MDLAHQAPLSMGFSSRNPAVGVCLLLQGTFPTLGSTLHLVCLLHCRWILYQLSHRGSPVSFGTYSSLEDASCRTAEVRRPHTRKASEHREAPEASNATFKSLTCVSYKLALAHGICHLPLQTLNPVLLQLRPSICPERSSGWRMRHSVLQGNWWNRSLDS